VVYQFWILCVVRIQNRRRTSGWDKRFRLNGLSFFFFFFFFFGLVVVVVVVVERYKLKPAVLPRVSLNVDREPSLSYGIIDSECGGTRSGQFELCKKQQFGDKVSIGGRDRSSFKKFHPNILIVDATSQHGFCRKKGPEMVLPITMTIGGRRVIPPAGKARFYFGGFHQSVQRRECSDATSFIHTENQTCETSAQSKCDALIEINCLKSKRIGIVSTFFFFSHISDLFDFGVLTSGWGLECQIAQFPTFPGVASR
jgi:hypothetical protein